MAAVMWMCLVLMGLAASQAKPQIVPQRFIFNDRGLQDTGNAALPGVNISPNGYARPGIADAPSTNRPSLFMTLLNKGRNFINGGVQSALRIGQAGLNLLNRTPQSASAGSSNVNQMAGSMPGLGGQQVQSGPTNMAYNHPLPAQATPPAQSTDQYDEYDLPPIPLLDEDCVIDCPTIIGPTPLRHGGFVFRMG